MVHFFPRSGYFWAAHLAGWSPVIALPPLMSALTAGPALRDTLLSVLVTLLATLACLSYRYSYWRGRWGERSILNLTGRLLILMLAATLLIVAAMQLFTDVSAEQLLSAQQLSDYRRFDGGARAAMIAGNGFTVFTVTSLWAMFYTAIAQYRHRQKEAWNQLRLKSALKESQLESLVRQINPHFIFNGLNNIRSLIRKDQERAIEMITALSEVLRCSLKHHARATVSLQRELELVDDYIALADLQFGDRLEFRAAVTVNAKRISVPPMCLQTLVENAIKHGIGQRKSGGRITLKVSEQFDYYRLEVYNTGSVSQVACGGTGLANLRERLALIYGPGASVALQQEGDEVLARVQLPKPERSLSTP